MCRASGSITPTQALVAERIRQHPSKMPHGGSNPSERVLLRI